MTHFHNPNTPNHNSLHDPSAPPDKAWLRLSIAPTHLHHPQPLKINESLPHLPTPFQLHPALHSPTSNSDILRVIDPPRRPQSGIWFSLQPLELNQGKQPALPQRSTSYLRIKDGRMRVGLVMKYLVKKLRLESETEVEIWCRGEKVEGWLTMQQIRDNIWTSKHSSFTLLPHSSTIPHIMLLHYSYSY
ncbi:protein LAX PANICLE 2-like [Cucurbita pepo subsp. pepo]|uniref:protein LAX PANICLE 2-like n=1 Tax=Cucurbita pepo subsp. pepo TaxID=3664 RepID=UPI000C9D4E34|nr:protein LAX PANICLE 2-like [Cucurbita pepo subsp. pepo]